MSKTQAERAKKYRDGKKAKRDAEIVTKPENVTECDGKTDTGIVTKFDPAEAVNTAIERLGGKVVEDPVEGGFPPETLAMVDAACGDVVGREEGELLKKIFGHYQGHPECDCGMCKNWRAKGKNTNLLHHGQFPMSAKQLALMDEKAGVRDVARNRVPLPGDTDYEPLEPETDVKKMSRSVLQGHINAYPGDSWVNSPEHKELMCRLHKWDIPKLEKLGYSIPAWKAKVAV